MGLHRRVAALSAAVVGLAALPYLGSGLAAGGGNAARADEVRPASHAGVARWAVSVSLSRRRIGPLRLRTSRMQRAPHTSSQPWVEHDLRIANMGDRKVRLGDTRTSAYLRGPMDRALLGADEGCGYGFASGSDEIDVGVCASYLDVPTLRPGERIKRTVTLFKGLKGMSSLRTGTYVFRKRIRYKVRGRSARSHRIRLIYRIEPR